jgi:hypothetical protein
MDTKKDEGMHPGNMLLLVVGVGAFLAFLGWDFAHFRYRFGFFPGGFRSPEHAKSEGLEVERSYLKAAERYYDTYGEPCGAHFYEYQLANEFGYYRPQQD